jgi:hypothetical protein
VRLFTGKDGMADMMAKILNQDVTTKVSTTSLPSKA